jgi:N-acetylglucosamine-6-phosphate deacetylase
MGPRPLMIKHCTLLDRPEETGTVSITCRDGVIAEIGKRIVRARGAITLDAEQKILIPGFIDIHVQGAGGADVLDGTHKALSTISKTCARFGATGFLATTVYNRAGKNQHLDTAASCVGKELGGAVLLGIHLEGPFISMKKRGMIHPECIGDPSDKVLNDILERTKGTLKLMTIAPELRGSLHSIRSLVRSGVIASFGHSNASYEETLKGFDAGITHVTHLFNAMPSLHHRVPGPLLAIFRAEDPSVQLIPDGVHLHPRILKFALDILGPERVIIITDGMKAMGLPDGKYEYNGMEFESKNGTARYADGTLIGTSLGMIQLVLRLMEYTDCAFGTAVKTASHNPAKVLGVEQHKGSIAVGMDADLVLLDHDYSVWATIVSGKIVYQKG